MTIDRRESGTAVDRTPTTRVPARDEIANPGLPPHEPRRSDVDPKANRRAQRQVAALFGLSMLGTVIFVLGYFFVTPHERNILATPDTLAAQRMSTIVIGLGLTISLFFLGTAIAHFVKSLMPDEEMVEARHPMRGEPETREEAAEIMEGGIGDLQIGRRKLVMGAGAGALALLPLLIIFPLGTLGPADPRVFRHTFWDQGVRLMRDPGGGPIAPSDVTLGSIFHVMPEGLTHETPDFMAERAKAAVIMMRLDPTELSDERRDWQHEGIIAFSKICTHVGCPVALYEQQTHHLLCPCHQSTFDVTRNAEVIFGPADRPLPQLPITVNDDGYLVAQSDFHESIGASYWEREKHNDLAED